MCCQDQTNILIKLLLKLLYKKSKGTIAEVIVWFFMFPVKLKIRKSINIPQRIVKIIPILLEWKTPDFSKITSHSINTGHKNEKSM